MLAEGDLLAGIVLVIVRVTRVFFLISTRTSVRSHRRRPFFLVHTLDFLHRRSDRFRRIWSRSHVRGRDRSGSR